MQNVFMKIAQESATEQLRLNLTPTEKEWLGKLAVAYKMPKAQVLKRLLHQAIADRLDDKDGRGEVLALSRY